VDDNTYVHFAVSQLCYILKTNVVKTIIKIEVHEDVVTAKLREISKLKEEREEIKLVKNLKERVCPIFALINVQKLYTYKNTYHILVRESY